MPRTTSRIRAAGTATAPARPPQRRSPTGSSTDPTGSGDPDFLIIGDLNSYTFETPIQELEAGGFENLVRKYAGLTAYSYVFNGESGYLDHALGTASMAAQVTGVTEWHINPDEPTVLDYNTNFKSANHINTLYDPGPYRSSDHDPVIVGIGLNHAPTADAGGPYTVAEGSSRHGRGDRRRRRRRRAHVRVGSRQRRRLRRRHRSDGELLGRDDRRAGEPHRRASASATAS